MTAVVPPTDAPFAFEEKTGQIFQNCTCQHGECKYRQWFMPQSVKQQTEQKSACSVDRKIRSFVYASVNKGVFREKEQQYFPEPAREGGDEKEEDIIGKSVGG